MTGASATERNTRSCGSSSPAIEMWKRKKMIAGLSTPPVKAMRTVMTSQSRAICTRAKSA